MIDEESKRFMDWAFLKLSDPKEYAILADEALALAKAFYDQDQSVVLDSLRAKMERGAIEHGAPNHPDTKIDQELANEYLDLLGWLLVKKWNNRSKEELQ